MNKNVKITLATLIGLSAVTAFAISSVSFMKVKADRQGRTPEVFTTADSYAYRTKRCLGGSPDSFEAWINLPKNSIGGSIAGNYSSATAIHGSYNWEIDGLGRVKIIWDDAILDHTFNNVDLFDAKWHHVAVIRDDLHTKFDLYIDGVFTDTVNSKQRSINTIERFNIASDLRVFYSPKGRLDGKVKQVTVYEGPISAERIRSDMENTKITTNDTNARLLGNWYLGEQWTERHIADSSNNNNQIDLITVEKYVGLNEYNDYDYMFMVLPDIQICNRYRHDRYMNMMRWILNNSSRLKNQFVLAVGDLSDYGPMEELYRTSSEGFMLLNNEVPYCVVQGNHDYDNNCNTDRSSTFFNTYYPYSIMSKLPNFAGAFEEGTMANTYYLFEMGEIKYCVINIEFGPRLSVMNWAGRLCERYSDRRVIIQTHAYLDPDGGIDGDGGLWGGWRDKIETTTQRELWDNLIRRHKNIFMVFSGHHCCDDIVYTPQVGDYGNTVRSFLMDTQNSFYLGKNAIDNLCMVKINERKKTAHFAYYSPELDACYNLQNQFDISFADPLNPTVGA